MYTCCFFTPDGKEIVSIRVTHWAVLHLWICVQMRDFHLAHSSCQSCLVIGSLSKTSKDDDGKVGKTIKLITQDKKHTWIREIKRIFMPSCSRVRRQLLHFHVVCKTWSIFQELSSIFLFRKRRWKQLNFSENRNKHCNQSKYMLRKTEGSCRNIFTACWLCCHRRRLLKLPSNKHTTLKKYE